MNLAINVFLVGVGATAFIDVCALLRRRVWGMKLPNYALVGRWIGLMPGGRFSHPSIALAPPVPGEAFVGWTVHYSTGIAFAAFLTLGVGAGWLADPTMAPALCAGMLTVAAPLLVMQPAMGAAPTNAARLQSLINHSLFGLGLYLSAKAIRLVTPGE